VGEEVADVRGEAHRGRGDGERRAAGHQRDEDQDKRVSQEEESLPSAAGDILSREGRMGTITAQEREAAVAELEGSRRRLLAAIEGVTGEQWTRRPEEGRGSLAEGVEHIGAAGAPPRRLLASGAP